MSASLRRPHLTTPGLSIIGVDNFDALDRRATEFARDANLDDCLIVSVTSAVPIPAYEFRSFGSMRWPGVEPSMMFHPLFWLPQDLVDRRLIEFAPGKTAEEDDDQFAARMAVTLQTSLLYDDETGTWLDVLAYHGLDSSDQETLDRIQLWLDGAEDTTLDSINVEYFIDPVKNLQGELAAMSQTLVHQGVLVVTNQALEMLDDIYYDDDLGVDLVADMALFAGGIASLLPQDLDATAFMSNISESGKATTVYESLSQWLTTVRDEAHQIVLEVQDLSDQGPSSVLDNIVT